MRTLTACLILALAAIALSACGAKPATPAIPTSTTVPTYVYQAPTEPPVFASLAATEAAEASAEAAGTQVVILDPEQVTRGQDRYVTLKCGSCHGDQGQGTDQGGALVPLKVDEAAFIKFLQTGGGLGNAHLFAGNKLSASGAHNLYIYVLSLAQSTEAPSS